MSHHDDHERVTVVVRSGVRVESYGRSLTPYRRLTVAYSLARSWLRAGWVDLLD